MLFGVRLTDAQATQRAAVLHSQVGLSWRDVEKVMAAYHGCFLSHSGWYRRVVRCQ